MGCQNYEAFLLPRLLGVWLLAPATSVLAQTHIDLRYSQQDRTRPQPAVIDPGTASTGDSRPRSDRCDCQAISVSHRLKISSVSARSCTIATALRSSPVIPITACQANREIVWLPGCCRGSRAARRM